MSLILDNVSLSYPDGRDRRLVLNSISLNVDKGQLIAVTGSSGSGKSSLLSVAGALITPDSGSVVIAGVPITGLSQRDLARMRLEHTGFIFQQDNLLPSLTSLDQLVFASRLRGLNRKESITEALSLLHEVGLSGSEYLYPKELSGGMRQRVNIARALIGNPSVILIDEPTASLDYERGCSIISLLSKLVHERDLAAVLVTHDLDRLMSLSQVSRVIQLHDGKVVDAASGRLSTS